VCVDIEEVAIECKTNVRSIKGLWFANLCYMDASNVVLKHYRMTFDDVTKRKMTSFENGV